MSKAKPLPDLAAISPELACETPFEIEIEHPKLGKLGVFISVLGMDGKAYKRTFRKVVNAAIRTRAGLKDGEELPADQDEKSGAELIASITTGWRSGDSPVVVMNGEELEFTTANAAKLYQSQDWIREQVEAAARNLGNFMPD